MVNQCHADEVSISCLVQLFERVKFLESGTRPKITSQQQHNLRKTWARFAKGDNDKAGLAMFLELFRIEPEVKKHFDFAKDTASSKMQSSSRMMFHVSRVAWHICEVIEKLETLEDIVPVLKQVGSRHNPKGYNIPPTTLPKLGKALINLMSVDKEFTKDDAAAWTELFGWIVDTMVSGMGNTACC